MAASTRLSVSIWAARRLRPAPTEARMAISRRRAALRASSRLARLAHAIKSRKAAAPASIKIVPRTPPASHPRSGTMTAARVGNRASSVRIRLVTASISACAASRLVPGRRRPMTSVPPIPPPPGLVRAAKGIQMSLGPKPGKWTSGGRTPMTVTWRSLRLMVCPNTPGLAANSRCQKLLLSRATISWPG